MIIKKLIIKLFFMFFMTNNLFANANTNYFEEGLDFFKKKKFEEAKFKFEQDILFNPKNEKSYLFLSKIFRNLDNQNLEEQNLNTVILLNPKNEEAIYNLAKLKLKTSDYKKSKELNDRLSKMCKAFCKKNEKLKIEIENYQKNKCNFFLKRIKY